MPSKFLTLKFLYQNPIGRALVKDHVPEDGYIRKAKNDPNLEQDPLLAKYVMSIPKAIRFRGVLLQGYLVYSKVLKKIESFPVRCDDVWLCTYPKSGTTWTEEILSLIFNDGNLEQVIKKHLEERVPHLEVGKPLGHMKWLKTFPSPRLLATHLNAQLIPEQLRQGKAKIIYVVRNPKDNAVSYYHHHKISTFLGNYSGTWADFLQLFMNGHLVYGDWFEHVSGFWEMSKLKPESVLVVSYEELKVDLRKMIQVICEFVGRSLPPSRIDDIVKHCSFEQMRNNNMVNRENLPVADLFDMSQTKFMRKGIIGDWRNYFNDKQNEIFDKCYEQRLNRIGLNLAYDHQQATDIMEKHGRIIRHPNMA